MVVAPSLFVSTTFPDAFSAATDIAVSWEIVFFFFFLCVAVEDSASLGRENIIFFTFD